MSFIGSLDRTTASLFAKIIRRRSISTSDSRLITTMGVCNVAQQRRSSPLHQCQNTQLEETESYLDAFYINALARAGSCRRHASQIGVIGHRNPLSGCSKDMTVLSPISFRSRMFSASAAPRSRNHVAKKSSASGTGQVDSEDLKATKPSSDLGSEEEAHNYRPDPRYEMDPRRIPRSLNDDEAEEIKHELVMYLERLRYKHSGVKEGAELYTLYKRLPSPGVAFLANADIDSLLIRLATVDRPDPHSQSRFLNVLDDLRAEGMPIQTKYWNTAIWLTGLGHFKTVLEKEDLENAIAIYKHMKRERIRPNARTYHLLVGINAKAHRYDEAIRFAEKCKSRGFFMNRFMKLSLIDLYGRQKDSIKVRKAFDDFVESQEVVDTVVLNGVIAALLRCGDRASAEDLFAQMKIDAGTRFGKFINDWDKTDRRQSGRRLAHAVQRMRTNRQQLEYLRELSRVAPDIQTYKLMIGYNARVFGQYDRTLELLDEMNTAGLPVQGSIFKSLFNGFSNHGGAVDSKWTPKRLEQFWEMCIGFIDDPDMSFEFREGMVFQILHAFGKLSNKERLLDVWTMIEDRWKSSVMARRWALNVLRECLDKSSSSSPAIAASNLPAAYLVKSQDVGTRQDPRLQREKPGHTKNTGSGSRSRPHVSGQKVDDTAEGKPAQPVPGNNRASMTTDSVLCLNHESRLDAQVIERSLEALYIPPDRSRS